jgi:hypothetical protein
VPEVRLQDGPAGAGMAPPTLVAACRRARGGAADPGAGPSGMLMPAAMPPRSPSGCWSGSVPFWCCRRQPWSVLESPRPWPRHEMAGGARSWSVGCCPPPPPSSPSLARAGLPSRPTPAPRDWRPIHRHLWSGPGVGHRLPWCRRTFTVYQPAFIIAPPDAPRGTDPAAGPLRALLRCRRGGTPAIRHRHDRHRLVRRSVGHPGVGAGD